METNRTEGIIIHTLDFRDNDQILTVFTRDLGIIKFFFKGAKRKKGVTTSPLTTAEFVYQKRKSDLLLCQEISVISLNTPLRNQFDTLQGACDLIKALKTSQFPERPAPTLYGMLQRYLDVLPRTTSPKTLAASFCLKILKNEGNLGSFFQCNTCRVSLSESFFVGGESHCEAHAPQGAMHFSEDETEQLLLLAHSRKLSEIQNLEISRAMADKVQCWFESFFLA